MLGSSVADRELLDTAALCGHLVPAGSVYAFLAEHRRRVFPDEMFADLFPSGRGRPSVPADVIAAAFVLKELEGLSDRQAAAALSRDIAWKAACGMGLDEDSFDASVFVYWRRRLNDSERPHRIDEAVKTVAAQTGVLAGKARRALDSTVLDDAVATQDTVTQLVAAIRKVRRLVPEARQVVVGAHDYDHGGKPDIAWDDEVACDALVSALVADAIAIIDCLPVTGLDEEAERAVALLALIAGQDVEPGEQPGTWRIARAVAKDRVVSVVDDESRHAHKSRASYRDGYKGHIACEPETGLVTANTVTPGNTGDGDVAVELLEGEDEPVEVLADSAYGGGATRSDLDEAGHTAVIKPLPLRPAVPGGFDRDDFAVCHDAGTVTCPAGHTVAISAKGHATFGRRCDGCPLRDRCTTSRSGRSLRIGRHDRELVAARAQAATPEFAATYPRRSLAERSISWLMKDGHRRCRYRGVKRNQLGLSLRVAAVNLTRLLNLGMHYDHGWQMPATT
ncbi:IS1182 family transposase [Egibacter rhizosphaerae]|uniref:IS1182 family transposase n=1 Tax=Egibacter rhizosphaerae TaxID=1670831 RepID=A0A411YLH7_9ACTN|nr:IS1182 family transposase [Egibacter rhizosphaerae]QBI22037.1 IS1182 family transposase [Egibacter rhizosphaerae]